MTKYLSIICILLIGCNNKPSACFEGVPETVQVGVEFTVSSCSENTESYEYDYGNGYALNHTNVEQGQIYDFPGQYQMTFKAFGPNKTNRDQIEYDLLVAGPSASQLVGTWTLYETREVNDFDEPNGKSVFYATYDSSQSYNEQYLFTLDSVFVTNDPLNFITWGQSNHWSLGGDSLIYIRNYERRIVRFDGSEMVWMEDGFFGKRLFYLRRD